MLDPAHLAHAWHNFINNRSICKTSQALSHLPLFLLTWKRFWILPELYFQKDVDPSLDTCDHHMVISIWKCWLFGSVAEPANPGDADPCDDFYLSFRHGKGSGYTWNKFRLKRHLTACIGLFPSASEIPGTHILYKVLLSFKILLLTWKTAPHSIFMMSLKSHSHCWVKTLLQISAGFWENTL